MDSYGFAQKICVPILGLHQASWTRNFLTYLVIGLVHGIFTWRKIPTILYLSNSHGVSVQSVLISRTL